MESIESLLLHLETLDKQLSPSAALLQQEQLKLIKEVLVAKHQISHHLGISASSIADPSCREKLEMIITGRGLNIDRINADYSSSVVCPHCKATDVALIRHISSATSGQNHQHHQNRRVKLVQRRSASNAGTFACNSCATSFNPSLPPNIVKLCEMLFRFYF